MGTVKVQKQQRGFTIIEVVLVLAIAGLIFLMVFIALPALQAGQRDTQRKSDLARINTQISNYQSSNRGKIPSEAAFKGASGAPGFVEKYLGGTTTETGEDYLNPGTDGGYKFSIGNAEPTEDTPINYYTGQVCGDDGATTGGNARNYTLRIKLEGQVSPYCIDNAS